MRVRGSLSPNTELVLRRGELEERDMAKIRRQEDEESRESRPPFVYRVFGSRSIDSFMPD